MSVRSCRFNTVIAAFIVAAVGTAACSEVADPPAPDSTGGRASSHLVYDCATQASIPESECDALVALYDVSDGDSWNDNSGWLTGDPCTWFGVSCSGGSVVVLDLGFNQLDGSIPTSIGDLGGLTSLVLWHNQLTGAIPT